MKLRYAVPSVFFSILVACSSASTEPVTGERASLTGERAATCACALEEVCSVGQCIARPEPKEGELFAELELLRQASPMNSTITTRIGRANGSFHVREAPPVDTRPKVLTPEGEECFFEVGTSYPNWYDGKTWPSTPGLDAGKLTFTVLGAASPIELDPLHLASGWAYFHGHVPPPMGEGTSVYPDFFEPSYLPFGQGVKVSLAGGQHVAAATLAAELPAEFTVTAPAIESPGASVAWDTDLAVAWSPAQSSAYMEISLGMAFGQDLAQIRCKVKDDGQAIIPRAVMQHFVGNVGIQLRRTTERHTRIEQADGKIVHAFVLGHHARIGALDIVP